MKSVVEAYIGIWSILLLFLICLAFTSINMNIKQANKMFDDIKAQVQASNGSNLGGLDSKSYSSSTTSGGCTIASNGFEYDYVISRKSIVNSDIKDGNETYIYNEIYKITLKYRYSVPLFGTQEYPITGYSN